MIDFITSLECFFSFYFIRYFVSSSETVKWIQYTFIYRIHLYAVYIYMYTFIYSILLYTIEIAFLIAQRVKPKNTPNLTTNTESLRFGIVV